MQIRGAVNGQQMSPEPHRMIVAVFDPVERAEEVATLVCDGDRRKYHRFRPAPFYGGIATADCVGCNLRCAFCWSFGKVTRPEAYGRLHGPGEVASRLLSIARKRRFGLLRISGNEPTLGREHLIGVLERIPSGLLFILETNGILLGHDADYARELASFPNLHVRISLKGASEEEFARLTGAGPEGFGLQIEALRNLHEAGARVHAAAMTSFSPPDRLEALRERLGQIDPCLADFEVEELMLYGDVGERLEESGITYRTAHDPRRS
ncbi:MAG: radical SAM protein [Planctomycetota bacterium]